ncbi:FAD-dependent monooxygenase [Streptomyces daliensis]|uniref:FAD-dependent monooxygenase n=1 Tax=Streptomyces daliensis TaxID=299421 RepID=A0A8T4J1J6_9ACTN|nr:FAD-dependent monooxygenase [Streptomyces daliensis]
MTQHSPGEDAASAHPRTVDERTSVVVVGAGPAGLTVANLLRTAGVPCVLLEAESRAFIEQRPRAGFVEEWAVRALERRGLADRLLERAGTHEDCEFRMDGVRHLFRYAALSGQRHFAYPQPLLVTDLLRAYAGAEGGPEGPEEAPGTGATGAPGIPPGDVRFDVADVRLHAVDSPHPSVSYTDPATGLRHRVACDFVAGCDGARGVSRAAIPEDRITVARHDLGVGWLALLAQAPQSCERVTFGLHPHGFAAHMARTPDVTRYYLECPPDDSPDNWSHERVWSELRQRLDAKDAAPLIEGELIERRVLSMHNYVVEPMSYGRLYLAGDAAQLLAPIGAKGMNLALHHAILLADALTGHYAREDDSGLAGYSAACLRRVWQYHEFTQWLSDVFHGPSSGNVYRAGLARARLRRMTGSDLAGSAVAGLYIGSEAEH